MERCHAAVLAGPRAGQPCVATSCWRRCAKTPCAECEALSRTNAGFVDGPAASARFYGPSGLAAYRARDGRAYVLVADRYNSALRKVEARAKEEARAAQAAEDEARIAALMEEPPPTKLPDAVGGGAGGDGSLADGAVPRTPDSAAAKENFERPDASLAGSISKARLERAEARLTPKLTPKGTSIAPAASAAANPATAQKAGGRRAAKT